VPLHDLTDKKVSYGNWWCLVQNRMSMINKKLIQGTILCGLFFPLLPTSCFINRLAFKSLIFHFAHRDRLNPPLTGCFFINFTGSRGLFKDFHLAGRAFSHQSRSLAPGPESPIPPTTTNTWARLLNPQLPIVHHRSRPLASTAIYHLFPVSSLPSAVNCCSYGLRRSFVFVRGLSSQPPGNGVII
jgi:hypothetical protein